MSYSGLKAAFFCVGDGSRVLKRFGVNVQGVLMDGKRQILMLTLADKPLNVEEIKVKTGWNGEVVLNQLDVLLKAKLVEQINGSYATTIPVLTVNKAKLLASRLEGLVDGLAGFIAGDLGYLRRAYEATRISLDFPWEEVAHIIVDALTLDLSMLGCVENNLVRRGLYEGWGPWQRYIPYLGLELGSEQWNLGVNSSRLNGYGISIMHSTMFERDPLTMLRLHECFRKPELKEALISLCEGKTISTVEEFKKLNIVSAETCKPNIPILRDLDKASITKAVVEVAHEASEIVVNNYEVVEKSFRELGYSQWLDGVGDFAMIAFHFLMALVPKTLAGRGQLPTIPKVAPLTWGVWLWEKPWTLDHKVLAEHSLMEAKEMVANFSGENRVKGEEMIKKAVDSYEKAEYSETLRTLQTLRDVEEPPTQANLGSEG